MTQSRNNEISECCSDDGICLVARSQRLQFDVSSPNGILLFREISKVIVGYGSRILTLGDIPKDQLYPLKYPCVKGPACACVCVCARACVCVVIQLLEQKPADFGFAGCQNVIGIDLIKMLDRCSCEPFP